MKVILPEFSNKEILTALNLPTINDFLLNLADGHFSKILPNPSHPLHDRIIFNVRTSCRSSNILDLSYVAQRKDVIAFLIILWNIATLSFYTGNNVIVFQNILNSRAE